MLRKQQELDAPWPHIGNATAVYVHTMTSVYNALSMMCLCYPQANSSGLYLSMCRHSRWQGKCGIMHFGDGICISPFQWRRYPSVSCVSNICLVCMHTHMQNQLVTKRIGAACRLLKFSHSPWEHCHPCLLQLYAALPYADCA